MGIDGVELACPLEKPPNFDAQWCDGMVLATTSLGLAGVLALVD